MAEAIQEQRRRLFLAEASRAVPGLYAWLATVGLPAVQKGAPWSGRAFALLGVLALVGSFVLSTARPRVARWLGVYVFILSCFATWALLDARLRADQLDPIRGALGAVGFLLHALAWGASPGEPDGEALDNLVPGLPLEPRQRPPRLGSFVLGGGIALGLLPMAIAFGVERPASSLLAHSLALGAGLLVVGTAADVALRVGKPHRLPAWRARASRAIWPIGALTLSLAIGLLWLGLR
jgi:hypothetical protein